MEEGVIKFQQRFTKKSPINDEIIEDLNFWRQLLYYNHLIGKDPTKYNGAAYGNLSKRLGYNKSINKRKFVITGTQTSGLAKLTNEHYSMVLEYYPESNLVFSEGPIRASSESMTHGAIYDLDNSLRYVFHGHAHNIWRFSKNLKIPITLEDVEYGTPEMAEEVKRLFKETDVINKKIFAMGGHKDGIISFGKTIEESGMTMLNYLQKSLHYL